MTGGGGAGTRLGGVEAGRGMFGAVAAEPGLGGGGGALRTVVTSDVPPRGGGGGGTGLAPGLEGKGGGA